MTADQAEQAIEFDIQTPLLEQLNISPEMENFELLHEEIPFELYPNQRTVVLITAVSGGGKDEHLRHLEQSLELKRAVTSTTRRRRFTINENFAHMRDGINAGINMTKTREAHEEMLRHHENHGRISTERVEEYNWLPFVPEGMTPEEHLGNLKVKHRFAESKTHMDNAYGLTEEELERIAQWGKTPILRVDAKGAHTLQDELTQRGYNVLIIGVLPDDLEVSRRAIVSREDKEADPDNLTEALAAKVIKRMEDAQQELNLYKDIRFNYYLNNTRQAIGNKSGLEVAKSSMLALMHKLGVGVVAQ